MLPKLGKKLGGLPVGLVPVRELESFEGPILTEYKLGGSFYVEKWCTFDEGVSRFLLVRSEQRTIAEFLGGRITMLRLLTDATDGIGILIDRRGHEAVEVSVVAISEVPQSYLPTATRFHDEDLRPHWDVVQQSYLLDEHWNAKLLSDIERYYLNAIGFAFFTEPASGRRVPDGLLNFDMDGGFPYVTIFRSLRGSLPKDKRSKSSAVALASPGVLTLDAPHESAERLRHALLALPRSAHAYAVVQAWAKMKPRNFEQLPTTAKEDVERLSRSLNVDPQALFPGGTVRYDKAALLVAGKLIASYYRMLRRVLEPESGVEFLGVRVDADTALPPLDDDDDDDEYDEYDDDED